MFLLGLMVGALLGGLIGVSVRGDDDDDRPLQLPREPK